MKIIYKDDEVDDMEGEQIWMLTYPPPDVWFQKLIVWTKYIIGLSNFEEIWGNDIIKDKDHIEGNSLS